MNYLDYIETGNVQKLFDLVFEGKLIENGISYAHELTEEEQLALVRKIMSLDETDADNWIVFLKLYNRYHQIAEKVIDELFANIEKEMALSLIINIISLQGYTEKQGIAICKYMIKNKDANRTLELFQVICSSGKEFSLDIYNLLVRLDINIFEQGYPEQAVLARSYQEEMLKNLNK